GSGAACRRARGGARCRGCPPPAPSPRGARRAAMFDYQAVLWLIPGLPLLAAAVTPFLAGPGLRRSAHLPCILAAAASFVLSGLAYIAPIAPGAATEFTWFQVGDVNVSVRLSYDGLTGVMLL